VDEQVIHWEELQEEHQEEAQEVGRGPVAGEECFDNFRLAAQNLLGLEV
jgi:hypothetical protein